MSETPKLQLPNRKDFDAATIKKVEVVHSGPTHGSVLGVDYQEWVTAYVAPNRDEARMQRNRDRLTAAGYLPAPNHQVVGVKGGEAYVMPRDLYEQRMKAKRRAVHQAVAQRILAGSAIAEPSIQAPPGVALGE